MPEPVVCPKCSTVIAHRAPIAEGGPVGVDVDFDLQQEGGELFAVCPKEGYDGVVYFDKVSGVPGEPTKLIPRKES